MYNVFINTPSGRVTPKEFDKSLDDEYMNGLLDVQQSRYWKREIKSMMKAKTIAKAPVIIVINKEWIENQKSIKQEAIDKKNPVETQTLEEKRNEAVPVIEGQDPLSMA